MTPLTTIRLLLLGALTFGLTGTLVELVLLEHYEEPWQWAPIALVALALAVVAWHVARPSAANVQALQVFMAMIMAAGAIGVWFHFHGAAEFQYEIDPAMDGWTVFSKVIRVKTPPVLAPGLMVQLGGLGLIYLYCYRASARVNNEYLKRSDT